MKQNIRAEVCKVEKGDADWPPLQIDAFAEWLSKKADEIPEEYRKSAMVFFGGYYNSGSFRSFFGIDYERPETADEELWRESEMRAQENRQRERDLAELARLKAMYEPE